MADVLLTTCFILALLEHDDFAVRESTTAWLSQQPLSVIACIASLAPLPEARRRCYRAYLEQSRLCVSPLAPYDMLDVRNLTNDQEKTMRIKEIANGVLSMSYNDDNDVILWPRYFEATPYVVDYCLRSGIPKAVIENELLWTHWRWYYFAMTKTGAYRCRGQLFPDQPWWVFDVPFRSTLPLLELKIF